jgi:hypothetical protein
MDTTPQGLDLFHALGKFLYNKRGPAEPGQGGGGGENGGDGEDPAASTQVCFRVWGFS